MRLKPLAALMALSFGTLAGSNAVLAAVTDQMIEESTKTGQEVLSWGLGTNGQRYSPLK